MTPKRRLFPSLFAQPKCPVAVSSGDEDIQRMLRVKEDDVRAFEYLYEKYKGPVMSYLIYLTKNPGTAEELAQEVFLRIYRNRSSYTPKAKFSSWLWTITRNLAYDHLSKKHEFLVAPDPQTGHTPFDDIESPILDAELQLIQKADSKKIEKCLEELTPPQRETLMLRLASDLNYDEISEILHSSLSSVKSLLHRAKESLIDCFKSGGAHHG